MTTDQIKNVESAPGAPHDVSTPDTAADRATNEARQIIAKARYEAFRMVTEARNDADAILAEARAEAAELTGTGLTNSSVADENADLLVVNAALRAEYNELAGLIEESQQLIEALDTRLLDLATMPDSIPSLDGSVDEVAQDVGRQVAPFVFDYSPAVAPAPKPSRKKSTERAESFYTRKSAKLPRIGTEAGQDALDVVKSMRERMRD
jgi:cell division septum initiation protein DivIVA